ncbi:hypothetical protein WR25_14586 [Diploscapter pachys]|uniref:Histone RNA hairpin-binding protein RNA-binding domain-containing protein n=1 Tax=Diploscapter pachys TaxID=2018661 RepID=A0A2A2LQR2_9BILA|nr:hypothetical protein WR25_14586 [Diploscapter pachys]
MLNKSWAEITAEDEELNVSLKDRLTKSDSRRKPAQPKKAITKPKFVRSLELTELVYQSTGRRTSERIKTKQQERPEKTSILQRLTVINAEQEERKGEQEVQLRTTVLAQETSTIITRSHTTPTKSSNPRKRHLSNASTIPEEGCSPQKTARKNMRSDASPNADRMPRPIATSSPRLNIKEGWVDPKLGWCTDMKVIERRTKELDKAKAKDVYKKYIAEIPKTDRVRGEHPKTPNKMLNHSRRSWDQQVKKWKLALYQWAGWEPSDSVNTSFCTSDSEDTGVDQNNPAEVKNILSEVRHLEEILIRPETDAMASLLGHFDIDSKRGDESTLKAPSTGQVHKGPTDFSNLSK